MKAKTKAKVKVKTKTNAKAKTEPKGEGEAAIDTFLGPCYRSLLDVMCDVVSDAAEEEEEAIRWMFPTSGRQGPASAASEAQHRW